MIKGKPPFPFETIALAVSFSPGLPFLVSEMQRLCKLHDALAVFIHAGKKTGEKQRIFLEMLSANGFSDENSRIYWEHGETVSSILQICKHEVVDLLLIGASEKENFSLPVGSTTFEISKKAKCSVLIYSDIVLNGFQKIVVNGVEHDKTDLTVLSALYFAEKENVSSIFIVDENGSLSYADITEKLVQKANATGSVIYKSIKNTKVDIINFSLAEENCSTISEFAFKNNADLLVTNSSDHRLMIFDRISGVNSIDSLLSNLTTNLLIVHSRIPG